MDLRNKEGLKRTRKEKSLFTVFSVADEKRFNGGGLKKKI